MITIWPSRFPLNVYSVPIAPVNSIVLPISCKITPEYNNERLIWVYCVAMDLARRNIDTVWKLSPPTNAWW